MIGKIQLIKTQVLVILLFISCLLYAQDTGNLKIKKINVRQGLANNIVYDIKQDSKGFIWIATEEGINKFDGLNFILFKKNNINNLKNLSNNFTQALLPLDNDVFIATTEGLNRYNYETDKVVVYKSDPNDSTSISYNDITSLAKESDGNVWIGTYGGGVNLFDIKTEKFLHPGTHQKRPDDITKSNVISLAEDKNNVLWIVIQHKGVSSYTVATNQIKQYTESNTPSMPGISESKCIYVDSKNRVWVGTAHGLALFDRNAHSFRHIVNGVLSDVSINSITEDSHHNLWIGTDLFLAKFSTLIPDFEQEFPFTLIREGESEHGLSYSSVRCVTEDRDKNIWIGTYGGGINIINQTPRPFTYIQNRTEQGFLVKSNKANTICEDKTGRIWVGFDGGGLCLLDVASEKFIKTLRHTPSNCNSLPDDAILTSICDKENNIWIGTYSGGLSKYTPNAGTFTNYYSIPGNPASLPSNDIRTIFIDSKDNMWIGSSVGLSLFNRQTLTFYSDDYQKSAGKRCDIRAIVEDKSGNLWLAGYGFGIQCYNIEQGKITKTYTEDPNSKNTICDNIITSLSLYKDSVIIIGSYGNGMQFFNLQTGIFTTFNESDGLANNYVYSILADNDSNLWISTNKGISKFDPERKSFENFDDNDGVLAAHFMGNSGLKCKSGMMIFGGFSGINVFYPDQVNKTKKFPEVIFTNFLLFNQPVEVQSSQNASSPLTKHICNTKHIELNYKQSIFTVEFMAIDFFLPEKIFYSYFLEGKDNQWNNIRNNNSITYRDLSPGTYELKIKATYDEYVWGDDETVLEIKVKPPFWLTWWAKTFYILFIIFILFVIWYFSTLRIRTLNKLRIERFKRQKSEELHREKLDFFTNISHEFRTPLTLINGPLEKLINNETETEKRNTLIIIHRNANRLLLLINQLIDFRKIDNKNMNLAVRHVELVGLVQEIMLSFDEQSKQKQITLTFSHADETISTWVDPEFIDKILFNLLSNAFKFTPANGKIDVTLACKTDPKNPPHLQYFTELTVTDTGKGIPQKYLFKIFERFFQVDKNVDESQGSGIGLHLVKNLTELHRGKIEVKSEVGEGTSFRLLFPYDRKYYKKNEIERPRTNANSVNISHPVEDKYKENATDNKKENSKPDNKSTNIVLIIEDDPDIRNYVKSELQNNYQVEEATNGKEGLDKALEIIPDIIITDLMMPEMNGLELCKHIKSDMQTSHIPVIMLTAKSSTEHLIEGLRTGADSYIPKPFNSEHLRVRIQKLIETREHLIEKFSKKIIFTQADIKEVSTSTPDEEFLNKIVLYVNEHLTEYEINGDVMCKELGMSRMSLHRKLKAIAGQKTSEFIRNIKLQKATEYLIEGRLSISEICYETGFNSPSYFTKCFVNRFNITPTEYVLKNRKAEKEH